jgi:hypothetical protein
MRHPRPPQQRTVIPSNKGNSLHSATNLLRAKNFTHSKSSYQGLINPFLGNGLLSSLKKLKSFQEHPKKLPPQGKAKDSFNIQMLLGGGKKKRNLESVPPKKANPIKFIHHKSVNVIGYVIKKELVWTPPPAHFKYTINIMYCFKYLPSYPHIVLLPDNILLELQIPLYRNPASEVLPSPPSTIFDPFTHGYPETVPEVMLLDNALSYWQLQRNNDALASTPYVPVPVTTYFPGTIIQRTDNYIAQQTAAAKNNEIIKAQTNKYPGNIYGQDPCVLISFPIMESPLGEYSPFSPLEPTPTTSQYTAEGFPLSVEWMGGGRDPGVVYPP